MTTSTSTPLSLQELIAQTGQRDQGQAFQLENPYTLEVNINGMVWTKLGAMIAYRGNLKFEREGVMEHGLTRMLKAAVSGEKNPMMKVNGQGTLYLADSGKHITLLRLQNESININGNDLLAFEPSLQWDIKMIKRIAGMLAGGLFSIQLSGTGTVAICTHGTPMTLMCSPSSPVCTDPNATVAWSGNMSPDLRTDMSFRTFIGRGSGETFQMQFSQPGFVVVQPYEEIVMETTNA